MIVCIICVQFSSHWGTDAGAVRAQDVLFQAGLRCLAVIEMSGIRKKTLSAIQYLWHVLSSQLSLPSLTVSDAIKILELLRWWLNAQLLIFSGSYSTPLSNYGRNQMNCNWNKFPPEHFHFINTCFRFWEHVSSIASFMDVISNHYFLLKKKAIQLHSNTKGSSFEHPVPNSCKLKYNNFNGIVFTVLQKFWTLSYTFNIIYMTHTHCCFSLFRK